MAYNINTSHQQTRDELGSESDVNPIFERYTEKAKLLNGPSKTVLRGIGTSFILGSLTNGVLGTSTLGDYRTSGTVQRIENTDNVFNERFWVSTYIASTTGTINYTTGECVLSPNQSVTSTSIFYDASGTKKVSSITPNVSVSGTFGIMVSNNANVTTTTISNNETYVFPSSGSDLRVRITNQNASSTTINAYSVIYETYN